MEEEIEQSYEQFTFLITNINRCIKKIKLEEMKALDLKSVNLTCMYHLNKKGALTPKQLCELCGEDKANISRSIEYLKIKGYVETERQPEKRYKSLLKLTPKGKEIWECVSKRVKEFTRAGGVQMSDQDKKSMYKGLETINENLKKICMRYEK